MALGIIQATSHIQTGAYYTSLSQDSDIFLAELKRVPMKSRMGQLVRL